MTKGGGTRVGILYLNLHLFATQIWQYMVLQVLQESVIILAFHTFEKKKGFNLSQAQKLWLAAFSA